jgi:hypothetical protein
MFSAHKSHGHADGMRFNAPSRRALPPFGIWNFSGAWKLALGTLPSSLSHPHPTSTLSPVCERLIRVENSRVPTFPPTCHQPKIRPENKGIKPFTNRRKVMQAKKAHASYPGVRPICPICPIPSHLLGGYNAVTTVTFRKPIIGYYSLFTPIPAFLPPPGVSFLWAS